MAERIFIADKPTLDSVKMDTQYIKDYLAENSVVKSIQSGIRDLARNHTVTVDINPVDRTKSLVFINSRTSSAGSFGGVEAELESESTVRLFSSNSSSSSDKISCSWQVIEFY